MVFSLPLRVAQTLVVFHWILVVVALSGSQPNPVEDCRISQTLIASPAKPGGLLLDY